MTSRIIPPEERPFDEILTAVYDRLSRTLAGGDRIHPDDLLPGADDPLEGVIPDEFRPGVDTFDWFDPSLWAQASPDQIDDFDLAAITPASGPGQEGSGGDWFRGGEAPNNYANRHNPLYQARRQFAVEIADDIEDLFGVEAGAVGYMRTPKASDAAPGGRSSNSDHYSGGALDIYGTPGELDNLRAWLITQPFVSFVRWRSESHGGPSGNAPGAHLHVSFDIGWIAQNYFRGRQLPPLAMTASTREVAPPRAPAAQVDRGERIRRESDIPEPPPATPPPVVRGQPS